MSVKSVPSLAWLVSRVGWFESIESACLNCSSFESVQVSKLACVQFSISALCQLFVTCSFLLLCSLLDPRFVSELVCLLIISFPIIILAQCSFFSPLCFRIYRFCSSRGFVQVDFRLPFSSLFCFLLVSCLS